MLTLIESISLAGDRARQNDDAHGAFAACAWVIDGATDLHTPSLTGAASDAAWIAHVANGRLYGENAPANEDDMRALVRRMSEAAASAYRTKVANWPEHHWQLPLASMLLAAESADGVMGLDLGDCRLYALDADGAAHAFGGPPAAADNETKLAAKAAAEAGQTPLLRHEDTLNLLRRMRDKQNTDEGGWTFCLFPRCADEARVWHVTLKRPAYILLCTDGFSALADRYGAYDAGGLVKAALDRGLQELTRDLREIETADSGGSKHPRWKRSDDATAVLLRLT